eukprot:UN03931
MHFLFDGLIFFICANGFEKGSTNATIIQINFASSKTTLKLKHNIHMLIIYNMPYYSIQTSHLYTHLIRFYFLNDNLQFYFIFITFWVVLICVYLGILQHQHILLHEITQCT